MIEIEQVLSRSPGNRFEFRAVGSNQSIAGPLVAMNTIIAESIDYCATRLEAATGS